MQELNFEALRLRIHQMEDENNPELMAVCVALRAVLGEAQEAIEMAKHPGAYTDFIFGREYAARRIYRKVKEQLETLPPHTKPN